MSKGIKVMMYDPEFQKTLSESELKYISGGCNWIAKGMRETFIKAVRHYGKVTIDELLAMPIDEQDRMKDIIINEWNEYVQ